MEQSYDAQTNSSTVTLDATTIRRIDGLDLAVWYTPGGSQCYLSDIPIFVFDKCIIDAQDIMNELDYDTLDVADEDSVTITVNL